ncbi:MAG: hypothetical protein ABMA15_12695 [Vicinamibacterales bacterium]
MTQTFEDQLKRTLDSISERLQSNLTDHMTAAVDLLTGVAASDRQAAATEAAASTEKEVTARLTESFTAREDALREATRAEWFKAGLEQAQTEALAVQEAQEAKARTALDAANRATEDASMQARTARAEVLTLQQERDRLVRAALEAAAQTLTQIQVARAESAAESDIRLQELLDSLRSIDAATSLTHTLDALVSAARPQSDRVALFLLRGDTLRAWSHTGFEAMHEFGAQTEFAVAHAGMLADAVRSCTVQSCVGADGRRPAFAGAAGQADAFVAVPLMMNGQAIGVLCGEHLAAIDSGRRLTSVYEVLTRHSACVLESLTALRLANVSAHATVVAPQH